MTIRRLLYLLPLLVFLGVSIYFAVGLKLNPRDIPSVLIDKPVPTIDLPPLVETRPGFATTDFGGEVVVVNVFASWCIPCRIEHPLITRLAEEEGVTVFGLNWKDKKPDAIAWLEQLGNPYTRIGHDLDGRAGIDLGVYGVPESYIIDKKGRIRFKQIGPLSPDTLKNEFLPVVRELQAE